MKNSVAFSILLIYAIIASLGFFDKPSVSSSVRHVSTLPLILFAACYAIWYLRQEKPSRFDRIVSGFLSLVLVKVLFITLTNGTLDSFPLDILLLVILTTIYPLPDAIAYSSAVVLLNLGHAYFTGEPAFLLDDFYRVAGLFSTVLIVAKILHVERSARVKAEGRWEGIESLATNIEAQAKDRSASSLALSEEEKERVFLDSANELGRSLKKTMETIGALTGAYSCCLFTYGRDTFKLSSVISPSKRLIYEIPRQKGKNLIKWIEEHEQPLCMDTVPDFRALGYYSEDEGVRCFIGVPVINRESEVIAILSLDKRDGVFTKEDESLLKLAASAVAVFLGNSALISQMRVEAREFSAFYQLVKKLSTTLKLEEIIEIAMDFSKEIIDYDMTAITLKDDKGEHKVAAARGARASTLLTEGGTTGREFFNWVQEKETPVQFLGSRIGKKALEKLPEPLDIMGSFLCIPLIVSKKTIGIFITARNREMSYSPYEVKLFEALCAHVSVAVLNATMYGRMEELATKDGLTGLYNYRFFQERLSHEIERGLRYNQKLALILLDIDFFKKVNDSYGHPAGDKVLKETSSILAATVREVDLAARYGGEEFAIILINTGAGAATAIAERIRSGIESAVFNIGDGKNIRVTASMGISEFPGDADNPRLLISMADSALYRAKREGRNRVYCHSDLNAGNHKKPG